MKSSFDTSVVHRFDLASRYEWLETNGLGGYASSTIIGANTRRYHGLLVAATRPPLGRMVLLSKLDETLHIQHQAYQLGSNKYKGAIYPNGYIFQQQFEQELFPVFRYQVQGVELKKTIAAVHGENTTLLLYEVLSCPANCTLELLPLVASRDFHCLSHATASANSLGFYQDGVFRTRLFPGHPELFISAPGAHYQPRPDWYYRFEYQEELDRGQEGNEDLFSPGRFYIPLQEGMRLGLIISDQHPGGRDAWQLFEAEKSRRLALVGDADDTRPLLARLRLAADQFIVRRGDASESILAGYPWFSDWGRDAMIALPGLCLHTGRHQTARSILELFSRHLSEGMIPNRFPDYGETPEYNNIDATLWFFVAAWKYFQATQDLDFVHQHLLPAMREILTWHDRGTRYNIRTQPDGLLAGGSEGVQLTWMDAKAEDWVVTPRRGKAVEVNALWYNAWEIYRHLLGLAGHPETAQFAAARSAQIRDSFVREFWNPELSCLYDYVEGPRRDDAIRPNQLFAISLPFPLLEPKQAALVLKRIEEDLLTPMGLRSLAPSHPDYQSRYAGDRFARDGAYHQGTVWSWLLGPYIDAVVRLRGQLGKEIARILLENMESHLAEAGIGSISEIFDAEYPYQPKGCYAQAWSVGELLRVAEEYALWEAIAVPAIRRKDPASPSKVFRPSAVA